MSSPDSPGDGPRRPDPSPAEEPASPEPVSAEVPPDVPASPAPAPAVGTTPAPHSPPPAQPEYLMALEAPDPTPPTVGPPLAGAPPAAYGVPGPAAPGGGSRLPLVLVSIVAGLAVVASGVLAALLVVTNADLGQTRDQLAAVEAELAQEQADHQRSVQRLESDLQRGRDDLAALQQELDGAENMVELLRSEQGVIRRCVALNNEVVEAIITGNEAAFNAVIDEAEEVCDEADQILGN